MHRKFKYITNKKSELITNVTPLGIARPRVMVATIRKKEVTEVCINKYLKTRFMQLVYKNLNQNK